MNDKRVLIIGAGIAGISASIELKKYNFKPIILESKKFAGGRAYSRLDSITNETIDNGQHLLMGAYVHFLDLLKDLNTVHKLSNTNGIKIPFCEQNQVNTTFDTSIIQGRIGMLLGLFNFGYLTFSEKIKAIKFIIKLAISKESISNLTVEELLKKNYQSINSIVYFWEPLCLATMNSTVKDCSATIFKTILQKAFFSNSDFSRLIFPKTGLSELLGNWESQIISFGGEVHYSTKVEEFVLKNKKIIAVKAGDKLIEADYFISTIPPNRLKIILEKSKIYEEFKYLEMFTFSPIISIYLWFDKEFIESKINAIVGTNIQWIFNKNMILENNMKNKQNTGHYAITISGADALIEKSKEEILNICLNELNKVFPYSKSAKLIHSVVIKEKYATVKLTPKAQKIRPDSTTNIYNLFLAGDWTNTGLPATLESAALSGKNAVECIINSQLNNF